MQADVKHETSLILIPEEERDWDTRENKGKYGKCIVVALWLLMSVTQAMRNKPKSA